MALVLTIIAVVAGAALAAVNAVTAPQIEKINADNLAAGIKSVMGSDNITVADPQEKTATVAGKEKTFNIYNVTDASGASLGKAVQTSENGFGGELQVLVGFDNEGTILGYTVVGKNPGKVNFTVSKDGGDIDAITASTITSRAFLLAIKNAYDNVCVTDANTGATTQAKN